MALFTWYEVSGSLGNRDVSTQHDFFGIRTSVVRAISPSVSALTHTTDNFAQAAVMRHYEIRGKCLLQRRRHRRLHLINQDLIFRIEGRRIVDEQTIDIQQAEILRVDQQGPMIQPVHQTLVPGCFFWSISPERTNPTV